MSQSGRTDATGDRDAASAAATVADAPFVHIVPRASGDAVAAAGILARVLADAGTPFQVSVGRTRTDRARRVTDASAEDARVVIGDADAPPLADAPDATDVVDAADGEDASDTADGVDAADTADGEDASDTADDVDAVVIDPADEPASVAAWRLAGELGGSADSVLALVGVVAAGTMPGAGSSARLVEAAETSGRLDHRPGVAGPVDDVVDALAHSTFVHAPFSGDTDAARDAVDALGVDREDATAGDLDDGARRRIASITAVAATGHADAPPTAGEAIERALRPYVITDADVPFATITGYADVLDVLADTDPGTAVALALGHDVADSALSAWRTHAIDAHHAVRDCERSRHNGFLYVTAVDAPLATTARLVRAYRSPEPLVLAFDDEDDAVAVAGSGTTDLGDVLGRVTTQTGGAYDGTPTRGYATVDCDRDAFVTAFREAL